MDLRPVVAAVLVAGFASCTCAPAPQTARFVVTREGSGPANALPLNPLRVGSVLGEGLERQLIDGVIDAPGGRELRLTKVFSGTITRVRVTDEGLFFTGSTVDGDAPGAILVVPAKVRVGMAWDVFTEGDAAAYHFEVVERLEVADSAYGPGVQWRIDQTDAAGDVIGRRYLEGWGSTDALASVLWMADPAVQPSAAPKVELEPLEVPATFTQRGWLESLSLVRVGGGPGLFLANDEIYGGGGDVGFCATYVNGTLTPVMPVPGPPFRRTLGPQCVSTKYCTRTVTATGGYLDCALSYASGHASGVLVGSDGQLTWLPRSPTGGLAYGDHERAGSDFSAQAYQGLAVVPDAQGRGNVLFTNASGYGDLLGLGDEVNLLGDGSHPRFVANSLLGLPDLVRAIPLGDDTGGKHTLLLQTGDGMLWSATLRDGVLSPPRRHARLAGRFAVHASERGNEVLRVTGDGLVERLRVDDEGLGLDPVAQLALPAGEQAHSAFLSPEGDATVLLVATLAPDGRDALGARVKVNLYRSKESVTPQATTRPSPANGVWAVTAGTNFDALVCWSGGGAPALSGWTLGGEPAQAVVPIEVGGPCVLVFRAGGQGASLPETKYWMVEGPIPGQGRVMVRTRLSPNLGLTSSTVPPQLAALSGGGFASGRKLFGPGGVVLGVPTQQLASEHPQGTVPDAAGHGLWAMELDPIEANQRHLFLIGPRSFKRTMPKGSAGIAFPSEGGGVVIGVTPEAQPNTLRFQYVAPDGTVTDLPAPKTPEETYRGRLADGTLCGEIRGAPMRAFCRAPSGAEVSQPFPADLGYLPAFAPAGEGRFIVLAEGHYAFDGRTGTFVDVPPPHRGWLWAAPAADGSLWGVVTESPAGGPGSVVRFGPAGPVPVPIPAGLLRSDEHPVKVFPDEQVLLVVAQNGKLITVPRPR